MASLAPPISVQLTPQQVAWLDGRRQRGLLSRSAATTTEA
jgi:Arc/MetJ-type ribon-helix-helix transcriptional regulator